MRLEYEPASELWTLRRGRCTSQRLLPRSDSSPLTLHPTPHTPHPTPYTLHSTPYTLHPTPYTLHRKPYTLHPLSYTLNRGSEQTQGVGVGRAGVMGPHLHFGGFYGRGGGVGSHDEFVVPTLHSAPYTLHRKPYTLHLNPETQNPNPKTRNLGGFYGRGGGVGSSDEFVVTPHPKP